MLKPTNQKEHNKSNALLLLFWALSTMLIVLVCLNLNNLPFAENKRLKRQVKQLKQDSIQQYLVESTLKQINFKIVELNKKFDQDTLKALEDIPIRSIENTKNQAVNESLNNLKTNLVKIFGNRDFNQALKECRNENQKLIDRNDNLTDQKETIEQRLRLREDELRRNGINF